MDKETNQYIEHLIEIKKEIRRISLDIIKLEGMIEPEKANPYYFKKIKDCGFSPRVLNALNNEYDNFETLGDLTKTSQSYLLRLPNMGRKSVNEVRYVMSEHYLEIAVI